MRIFPTASRALLSIAILSIAGCAPAPRPQPAPPRPIPQSASRPAPPVVAPAPSDWRDRPITPGAWSSRADTRGSIASFGRSETEAEFTVRCDRSASAIYLSRSGDGPATGLTIRTSTTARTLPAQPTGAARPDIAARLSADDRLLDAIGFSRGRFMVEAPPLAAIIVPAHPEILKVVEDCRDRAAHAAGG